MTFEKIMFYALFGLISWYSSVVINANNCPTTGDISRPPFSRNYSCTRLLFSATGNTLSVAWNNNKTSAITYDSFSNQINGISVITYNGNVTDGLFNGKSFTLSFALTNVTLACETPEGMTQQSGFGFGSIGTNLLVINVHYDYSPGITNSLQTTTVVQNATLTFLLPLLVLC